MEQNSNNPTTALVPVPEGWTKKEMDVLKSVDETGAKPISVTLDSQMYNLFLEGYSCATIAKLNKGFTEADILYCRQRNKWDEKRNEYAAHLANQVHQKMAKQKLESIEHLTNILSVLHKANRDLMMKFLQTGNMDDFPQIASMKQYKDVIEILAKITGEDNTKRVKFDGKMQIDGTVKTDTPPPMLISTELQTKLLQVLARDAEITGPKKLKKEDDSTD